MLAPRLTRQFKKDVKKIEKSGNKNMNKLKTVLRKLIEDKPLENCL